MEGVVESGRVKAQHSKQMTAWRVLERRVDKDESADWLEPALGCVVLC
jgi:hypothetical protein